MSERIEKDTFRGWSAYEVGASMAYDKGAPADATDRAYFRALASDGRLRSGGMVEFNRGWRNCLREDM